MLRAGFGVFHVTFNPTLESGLRTNQINGPDVNTSGLDFQAQYIWTNFPGGTLALGVDGNHLFKYDISGIFVVS